MNGDGEQSGEPSSPAAKSDDRERSPDQPGDEPEQQDEESKQEDDEPAVEAEPEDMDNEG